jgi:hypothetical protein
MQRFLATITPVGGNLFVVDQVSRPTDPGYGGGFVPGHPDQGLPGAPGHPDHDLPWGPGHPDQGLPWGPEHPSTGPIYGGGHPSTGPIYGGGRPAHPLPVPPPAGVVAPPIYLPERPQLPAGAGVVVPLPEGATVPTPKEPPPAGTKPHVLWYGPGTQPSVVYLPPSTPAAAPKAKA